MRENPLFYLYPKLTKVLKFLKIIDFKHKGFYNYYIEENLISGGVCFMKRLFAFIIAVIMPFTVNVCAETENSEGSNEIVFERGIGKGITVYRNSEGKWGAYGDNFYLEADYYLPCTIDKYYAYDGVFVLMNSKYPILGHSPNGRNTFYIFNSSGEMIKSVVYCLDEVWEEKPCGETFSAVYIGGVVGSSIKLSGMIEGNEHTSIPLTDYIKRLYSEEVAGESYYAIQPYKGVGFKAIEKETDKKCILNVDGSFKEYIEEENG